MNTILRPFIVAVAAMLAIVAVSAPLPAAAQSGPAPAAAAPLSQATVKALQEALTKQGIAVKTDGVMSEETRAALKLYQTQHHLPVTGEADKATLDKLGVAAPQGAAAPSGTGGMGQGMGGGMMKQGQGGMMGGGMMKQGQGGMMGQGGMGSGQGTAPGQGMGLGQGMPKQ